jgi:hypothetical protein
MQTDSLLVIKSEGMDIEQQLTESARKTTISESHSLLGRTQDIAVK